MLNHTDVDRLFRLVSLARQVDNLTTELKETRALAEELHAALRAEQAAKATLQVRHSRRVQGGIVYLPLFKPYSTACEECEGIIRRTQLVTTSARREPSIHELVAPGQSLPLGSPLFAVTECCSGEKFLRNCVICCPYILHLALAIFKINRPAMLAVARDGFGRCPVHYIGF